LPPISGTGNHFQQPQQSSLPGFSASRPVRHLVVFVRSHCALCTPI
jgi:hypothetical protein